MSVVETAGRRRYDQRDDRKRTVDELPKAYGMSNRGWWSPRGALKSGPCGSGSKAAESSGSFAEQENLSSMPRKTTDREAPERSRLRGWNNS